MTPATYIVGPNGYAYYLCEIETFPLPRRFLFGCPVLEDGQLDFSNECLAACVEDPFLKANALAIQDLLRSDAALASS